MATIGSRRRSAGWPGSGTGAGSGCSGLPGLLAFVFGLYRLGLPHNFGKVHHFDAMIVLVLGVMVFARLGDAWSLDRTTSLTEISPLCAATFARSPAVSHVWPRGYRAAPVRDPCRGWRTMLTLRPIARKP